MVVMNNEDSRLGCRWTLEEDIKMCKLRQKGYNFKEIGIMLNRSEKSCATRYSNRGFTLNPLKVLVNITIIVLSILAGFTIEPSILS
jgi:hypothetical protein